MSDFLDPGTGRQNFDPLRSFDSLSLFEKRAALLLGFRWRDRSRLDKALAQTALIRGRLSRKLRGFDGVAAIRRWREAR